MNERNVINDFEDVNVVRVVLANPNCPASVLEKLSEYEDENIRLAVANHPNCPYHVLVKLSKDVKLQPISNS